MSNLKERCENTVKKMEAIMDMAITNLADEKSMKHYQDWDVQDFIFTKTVLAFFDEFCDLFKEYGEAFDKRGEALERIEKKLDKIKN